MQSSKHSPEAIRLRQAFERLPRHTRAIFLDHCAAGLSYEEIGRRRRIGARVVERHIARALIVLARAVNR